MLEVLNEFQNAALAFSPAVLVAGGVLCVLLGIIFWLAGTKFTKILAMVIGLNIGAIAAFHLFPKHDASAAIVGGLVGALAARFLHQFVAIITGSTAFAIAVVVFLVGTHFSEKFVGAPYQNPSAISVKISPMQTVNQTGLRLRNIAETLYSLSLRLPLKTCAVFAAATVLLAVVGMFFGRIFIAFACSGLGVTLICGGMLMLLLYKGSSPLTQVYERISFYFPVFAGMVAAGTVVQAVLCRPPKLKMLKRNEEEKKAKEKASQGEHR
jgi:hypothetical protein